MIVQINICYCTICECLPCTFMGFICKCLKLLKTCFKTVSAASRDGKPHLDVFPANISTSDQRCFSVVDQRWNNVDPTLKMKQNPTSDSQRCTTLIQRQCPTLKQLRNNVTSTMYQRCCNVALTSAKLKL